MEHVGVERGECAAQGRDRIGDGLDGSALGVERRVGAREVVLNQFGQAAIVKAVGNLLEGREVLEGLAQCAADALAVLRKVARHHAAGHHADDEHCTIEKPSQ
jgi:hypothetical protein